MMLKEIVLPAIAENITSGVVGAIHVSAGDKVDVDQILVEVETEKAVSAIPSSVAGTVKEVLVQESQAISVGSTLVTVAYEPAEDKVPETVVLPDSGSNDTALADEAPVSPSEHLPDSSRAKHPVMIPASPSVRRLARELGVDIASINGSGDKGRITEHDVKAHTKMLLSSTQQGSGNMLTGMTDDLDFSQWGDIEMVPFSKVRELTSNAMTHSWNTIPQVTHFDKADISTFETFRKQLSQAKGGNVGLTLSSVLVKIVADALKQFPVLNSSIDIHNKQLIVKKYYHIGVAVATEFGLLVPVVKHANEKGLIDIAKEISSLAQEAKAKALTIDQMSGGSFTISNLGGIGGTSFTPIVYAPQTAILGISRTAKELYMDNGEPTERLMLPLSLSYDHRAIDGAQAAAFLRWICDALENPWNMLL